MVRLHRASGGKKALGSRVIICLLHILIIPCSPPVRPTDHLRQLAYGGLLAALLTFILVASLVTVNKREQHVYPPSAAAVKDPPAIRAHHNVTDVVPMAEPASTQSFLRIPSSWVSPMTASDWSSLDFILRLRYVLPPCCRAENRWPARCAGHVCGTRCQAGRLLRPRAPVSVFSSARFGFSRKQRSEPVPATGTMLLAASR